MKSRWILISLNLCILLISSQIHCIRHGTGTRKSDDKLHQRSKNSRRFSAIFGNYSGDYVLGSLFTIHDYHHSAKICIRIQGENGIQLLEALYFTLDEINQSGFLPGFSLGSLAADSCDTANVALERSVEFVRDLTDSLLSPDQSEFQCRDGSNPFSVGTGMFSRVIGVLGASASPVSTQVASFLQLFRVPQVSYMSTTPDLSNKERYGYFLRTVPSDSFQALAIIQILRRFRWSYVSAVYDDSNYGSEGFGEVEKLAAQYGICFAVIRKIRRYPSSPDDDLEAAMDDVVNDLVKKKSAKAVIVFTTFTQARKLFVAANKHPEASHLVWVGSDGWSGRESVVEGVEHVVGNAITVQPLGTKLPGFDQYFSTLKPSENIRNPWFREYWASHFNCYWSTSPRRWREAHPKPCDETQTPSAKNGYIQVPVLLHVRNAAYVYAHALKNMHADRCGNMTGICPAMDVSNITGEDLLAYLRNVTFKEFTGSHFSFLNGVDGPPRYSILTFRKIGDNKYKWLQVGNYSYENGIGKMIFRDVPGVRYDFYPESVCSNPCVGQQAKKTLETDKCCWVCVNCSYHQFLPTEDQCTDCPYGFLPNANFNSCLPIPEVFIAHGQPMSIGLSFLALFGVLLCLIVGVIFFKFRNTPIIKASGKELSFILLAGVTLCYGSTLAFVSEPTKVSCGFTRFLFGLCYTICYAAIFTKTNRIARIFHGGQNGALKTNFINAKWQMLFLTVLTFVEVIILLAWCVIRPPDTDHLYPTRRDNIRICSESDDASYLIGLIYPFILVILCTIYAVKTRKTPDGFNETRFIAFCVYSTCVLWLSFVPIYFANSDYTLRVATLSVSLSANGTVILVSIFLPKIYIVMFRPNKNTREAVMTKKATSQRSVSEKSINSTKEIAKNGNISVKDGDISIISGPGMDSSSPLSSQDPSPKLNVELDIQNQSNDSGCYVNAGFRDSRTFVDEDLDVENVDFGLRNDVILSKNECEAPKLESDKSLEGVK